MPSAAEGDQGVREGGDAGSPFPGSRWRGRMRHRPRIGSRATAGDAAAAGSWRVRDFYAPEMQALARTESVGAECHSFVADVESETGWRRSVQGLATVAAGVPCATQRPMHENHVDCLDAGIFHHSPPTEASSYCEFCRNQPVSFQMIFRRTCQLVPLPLRNRRIDYLIYLHEAATQFGSFSSAGSRVFVSWARYPCAPMDGRSSQLVLAAC